MHTRRGPVCCEIASINIAHAFWNNLYVLQFTVIIIHIAFCHLILLETSLSVYLSFLLQVS